MAFASKVGSALRKSSVRTNLSLLQALRCMSSSKLFVGGLSFATDESSLKNAFSHYGDVLDARVIVDRDSGRSRGFGFVTYSTVEDAAAAVTAMDGKELQGRAIKVNYANDRAGGIRGGGGSGSGSFTNGYATGLYASTGAYDSGGYGSGHGSGAGRYGSHSSGYADGGYGSHSSGYSASGGYSDGATGGVFASNYSNASGGVSGYGSGAGYRDAATSGGYASNNNTTYCGGYAGGSGGYGGGATGGRRDYNNVSGRGYTGGNSGYNDGGTGCYANYNSTSGGNYARGNGGYGSKTTGGYLTNHNSTSGVNYAGGNRGYGDGTTGGYATSYPPGANYKNVPSGRYGSIGNYTADSSDGNTIGYNSPNTYGPGKHGPEAAGSGPFSGFGGGFSSGDSYSPGLNDGNTFAKNVTLGSYNSSTRSGGLLGDETMGFGTNKVQYNGQDDLLGEDFFDDKEAAGN